MKMLAGLDVGSKRTTLCVWMGVARSFGEVFRLAPGGCGKVTRVSRVAITQSHERSRGLRALWGNSHTRRTRWTWLTRRRHARLTPHKHTGVDKTGAGLSWRA